MIEVREAAESDVGAIRDLFVATYADTYVYEEFYDETALRKLIFDDDTLVLVAEDDGKVLGTASVVFEIGAFTDLVGEFGRLVVHPDARRRGIAGRLLVERVRRVEERLHVGFMEARVAQPWSVQNGIEHGFTPMGYLPSKLRFTDGHRESNALLVRYFGDALELRRNHPRVIPEAYRLATASLEAAGLANDLVVDEASAPYPGEESFEVEALTTEGYSSLLRIERGRLRRREIFGPLRLHYGLFRLKAADSHYLLARRDGCIAGAVGYTHDEAECNIRVFELISLDDAVVRFLLEQLLARCRDTGCIATIEIDVSAYAPRMQRTLSELGFHPAGYVPALAFHRVERLDLLKMVKLLVPFRRDGVELEPATDRVAELVLTGFEQAEILPRLRDTAGGLTLLAGLSEEQIQRLAGAFGVESFAPGETLFDDDDPSDEIFVLLSGEVEISQADAPEPLGIVSAGECLGEVSALSAKPHSATARALGAVETAVLPRGAFDEIVRRRPDIGVVVYRNLAAGLGEKLRRVDAALAVGVGDAD